MTSPEIRTLESVARDFLSDARRRDAARERGLPLGPGVAGFSRQLSDLLDCGVLPVGLSVFSGGTGGGKTAAALQIALTCGVPALLVECEMRDVAIFCRIMAHHSGARMSDLKLLSECDLTPLALNATEAYPGLALIDGSSGPAYLDAIADTANAWRRHHASHHALIVLDSLQSWAAAVYPQEREYERLDRAVRDLRSVANAHEFALIAISERAKSDMDSGSAYGKGTTTTGYQAELSLVFSSSDYDTLQERTPVNVTLAKNRHGVQGVTIGMWLEGSVQRFSDASLAHDVITQPRDKGEKKKASRARLDEEPAA